MSQPKTTYSNILQQPLTTWQAILYGLGVYGSLATGAMNSLSLNIFNITLGINAALITTAMAIVQFTGILLDPMVAHFSDNLRSRFGRRRPLIAVGSIVVGLTFSVMWLFPFGWSPEKGFSLIWPEMYYFYWYLALSLIMSFGASLFGSGYYALGIEVATDYKDRTRITAVRGYFSQTTAIINPWLFYICQLGVFTSAMQGVRWIGAIIGGISMTAGLISALNTKERFSSSAVEHKEKKSINPLAPIINFFTTVKSIGSNRYFWMCLGVAITLSGGLQMFEQFGSYVNIYYVFGGDTKTGAQFSGWSNMIGCALSIIAIPFAKILCDKLGKHVALRLTLGWMLIGSVLKWWCYNPHYPYLMFIIPFFYSVGIASFWLILPSMQADVVDIDELHSGKRREAMFGAVTSIGMRIATAGAIGLMGVILNLTGFVRDLGGGQAPETFILMRIMYSFAMATAIFLSLLFIIKYDLTAKRMEEVRLELEERRNRAQ